MSIEQNIIEGIRRNVYALYDTVREYESDTFSSTGAELTNEEAEKITIELINHALKQLIDCDTLDGVRICEELENLRPE